MFQHQNILIINLKYLGDLLVATPVYRMIREFFPDATITLLLQKGLEQAVDQNPNVDKFFSAELWGLRKLKGLKRLREELLFLRELRQKRFDTVIALHPTDRLVFWAYLSGASCRMGPKKQSFSFLLTHPVDVEEESKSYLEYYLDIGRAFVGREPSSKQTEYFLQPATETWAEHFVLQHRLNNKKYLIGIHPGASIPRKRWPLAKYAELVDELLGHGDFQVLVFQGPQEEQLVEELDSMTKHHPVIAKTSSDLYQLAALMKKCNLVICNDSGPRHLAAAVGTKTLTLFSYEKLLAWRVYSEEQGHFVVTGKLPCPVCLNGSCTGNYCLTEIPIHEVVQKVFEILHSCK